MVHFVFPGNIDFAADEYFPLYIHNNIWVERMVVDGNLGIYFVYRRSDDVKQKNKNHETIPSRFSLNRKKRVFCFTSSVSSAQNF